MYWKLLPRLLLLDLVLRHVQATSDHENICRRSNRVQIPSPESAVCRLLQNRCFNNNGNRDQERLVGTNIEIPCSTSPGDSVTFIKITGSSNQETTITSGGRFAIDGGTLTISNIQPEDEGEYRCTVNQVTTVMVCLLVSGLARFTNKFCELNFTFDYNVPPSPENSCSQHLNVTEGDDATFNTGLEFGDQGDCQCIEEVRLLRVQRKDGPVVFGCDERADNCINKSGFVVVRGTSGHPYDFSLVLPSVNMSHSGKYYVEVEVGEPGLTGVRRFWKIFQLTVNLAPPTEPTTTTQPVDPTKPNENISTTHSINISIGDLNPAQQPDVDIAVTAGVVGTIIFAVFILIIIIIIVVIIRSRRQKSSKKQISDANYTQSTTIEHKGSGLSKPTGNGRTVSICGRPSEIPVLNPVLESEPFSA